MRSNFFRKNAVFFGTLTLSFVALTGVAEKASANFFVGVDPYYHRTRVLGLPVEGSAEYGGVGIGLNLRYRFTIQGSFALDLVAAGNYTYGNNIKADTDEAFRRFAYGAGFDLLLGPVFFGSQFKFNRATIKDAENLRGNVSSGSQVLKYTTFSLQAGARIKLSASGQTQLMLGVAYEPGTAQPGGNVPGLGGGPNAAASPITVRAANIFANFIFSLSSPDDGRGGTR